MNSERKKYVIKLFLQRCTNLYIMKSHLKFSLELMGQRFNVPEKKITELKDKYTLDDYIERVTPVINEQFTIEEMQEAIKFFSSGVGKKMLDHNFLSKVGKIGNEMILQAETDFSIAHESN